MKKRFFKSVLSLAVALSMVMPSSLLTTQAAETVVYEYEDVAITNPVANSWYETTDTSGDGPASWAFDGNSSTHWHSNWGEAVSGNPHASAFTWATVSKIPSFSEVSSNREWIGGEFGRTIDFAKMEYTGRVGKSTNWYGQYALYLANVTGREVTDADFELAASGTNSGFSKVVISLETPKAATHFRFVAFTANPTGNNFVTASEIDVFEAFAADTTPAFGGSIVDNNTQWTQDRLSEVKRLTKTSAEVSAWKNDKALSEIALYAANAAYENVTVTASDLSDGNGNTISSENVTTTFIRSTKAYNGGYLGYGSPDRLIPADNGTNRSESSDILWTTEPVDMSANSVQPVWVEIAVPEDAKAGVYTGTISATADGVADALEFTYTVEVYDAVLPNVEDYTFHMMQWQYPYSSAEYYGVEPFSAEHLEILKDIMSVYKEVGGNAITTTFTEEAWSGQTYSANPVHYPSMVKWTKNANGSFSYDYSHFDAWVSLCKEMGLGDKIVAYGIAPWHGSFTYWTSGASNYTKEAYSVGNARYVAVWTDFLTDFAAHLEEKGWKENVYIGIDERGVSAAAFDVAEAAGLKTAADIDNITNHWAIAQRVTDLNVGDTAAYNLSTAFAQLKEIRDAKGFTTTLYSCTEHRPGNFSLSAPVESYWTVLNAGMMDADGFNRWAYDAWVADPLNDATHNSFEPGDCFVIYPDEKNAENPETRYSVRLARMAEGIRDVNKLAYMESEMSALAADVNAVYENIQYALVTSRAYLSASDVSELSAETAAFKADLNDLTEKYIALKNGGTYEVESVTIDEGSSMSVELNGSVTLHATLAPANLINTNVVWSSSNEYIVSVNENGRITGLQPGSATITATSEEDAAKSASIEITVTAAKIDAAKQVAYYSFDNVEGTALVDAWGDHDGTIAASAATAAGKSGKALSVTSAGQGAVIPNYSDLDAGDWTVSYWVNTSATFNKEISVLEDSEQKYSTSLKMADGRDAGFRVGNNSGDVLTFKHAFEKDTWYHLTWVQSKTGSGLSLYVNGELVETNNWTKNNAVKAPVEVIGGTGFTGLIDEVKVFNAALTQNEIKSLMLLTGINNLESSVELFIDETYQLNAYVISAEEDKTLIYESADPSIATVDENGLITAVGRGTTKIKVRNEAGGYEAEMTVKVSVEISIINQIPRYVLGEEFQSDVDGPYRENGAARRYLGQPDMVRTETGRLITVFPTGHGHGPLVMKISEDNGETWVEKTDIPSSWARSQETPTIYSIQVDDGNGGTFERLVLVCACPNWDLDLGGWQMSYSDDNGDTWTQFEDFWQTVDGNKHYTIVAMASLIQLKDEDGNWKQEWMGVYHDYSYINYKTILTFDEEGNPQWSKPEPYLSEYRDIESSHQICEVGMFRSPDGDRIVALGRNQTHTGPATMFYSDDEGKTWSEPVELPGSLAGERHKALYDPISGKLVITFREIIYDRNGNGVWEGGSDWICGEWVAWIGEYEDLMNLQQGDYKIILDEDFSGNYYSGDTGYTGMAVLEDGTFILHSYGHWDPASQYVSDVRTDLCWIRQAKFKLTDIDFETGEGGGEDVELPEIPTSAMTITAGNEELANATYNEGPIRYALDNNTDTKWHTDWYPVSGGTHETHWIQLALNDVYGVQGFKYLPRQDSSTNGDITGYEIQLSVDGEEWETVASGTWAASKAWKEVTFDAQNAKYVRLQVTAALSDQANKKFASAAEVRVLGGDAIETPVPDPEPPVETEDVSDVYPDVEHNAWYEPGVQYVYDKGIMSGSNGLFNPTGNVTRAQVVATLYKLEGSPEVTDFKAVEELVDIEAGQWYTNAVCWAYNTGVATGNQTTKKFNVNNPVTRQQLASFFYSYAGYKNLDITTRGDYSDMLGAEDVADYAVDTMKWAVGTGLITGSKTTVNGVEVSDLKPTGTATRAQIAAILQRFCEGNDL